MRYLSKLLLILLLSSAESFSKETAIVWNRAAEFKHFTELLNRAFEVTGKDYGDIDIVLSKNYEQTVIGEAMLSGSKVDIATFPPNSWREKNLIPIYIPLSRGMLGMRVCVVHKHYTSKLQNINSLSALKKSGVTFLSGSAWPDTEILRRQGLKVKTSGVYKDLFGMLTGGEFRCFSRSLDEIEFEMNNIDKFSLVVDSNILMLYSLPTMIFVSPDRPRLAQRVQVGLEKMISDGSFHKLFWKNYKETFKKYSVANRKIIQIPNDMLSDKVKDMIKREDLWLPSLLK